MAKFVVEMTHQKTGEVRYAGAVEKFDDEGAYYENVIVTSLDEARAVAFPTEEVAAGAAVSLPLTKNISYQVIEISEKAAKAGG